MKLSIATDAISADFETAVLLGLEWGIEHFELKRIHHKRIPDVTDDEVALVEQVLRTHTVTLSTMSPGLFKVPLQRELIDRDLGKKLDMSIALADRLGTRSVIVFSFERDDRDEAEALPQVIDILGRAARRAEAEGLTLFLENDRHLWGETPEALRAILSAVSSRALRLNWDPANLIGAWGQAPYPAGYALVREFVGHVHVKDLTTTAAGGHANVMVGSGDVDWVGQFQQLEHDGYDGFYVVEPHFGSRVDSSRQHVFHTRRLFRQAAARVESLDAIAAGTQPAR